MKKYFISQNRNMLWLYLLIAVYVFLWVWCYWWHFDFWWTRTFFDSNDFSRYFQLAQDHWYHRSISTEYPPLAILFFYWPLFFTKNLFYYSQLIGGQLLLVYILTIYSFYKLSKLYLPPAWQKIWLLLLLPSVFYFSLNRFDIFPVFFIILGLLATHYLRFKTAIIFFGLAILFKLYPILFLPLIFTYIYKIGGKKVMYYSLLFILILLATVYAVYGLIYGWSEILQPFFIYLGRADFYGSWLWLYDQLIGISTSSLTFWIKVAAIFGFMGFYGYWFYFIKKIKSINITYLFSGAALVLIWYHIFTSFYSPQWWLWYFPLLLLLARRTYDIVFLVFYDLLNYIQYPLLFNIDPGSVIMILVVTIRSLLLVYILYWVFNILRKSFNNSNYVLDHTANL